MNFMFDNNYGYAISVKKKENKMNKKNKELAEEYHRQLWTRIDKIESRKVDKDDMRISLPLPAHRATMTASLVEAVHAILNYLDLSLEKTPEVIAVKKEK